MKLKTGLFFLIVISLWSCQTGVDKKAQFGQLEIFYTPKSVSEDYVKKTGEFFKSNDLILDHPHSIRLTSTHQAFVLQMIVDPNRSPLPDSEMVVLNQMEADMKAEVFDGLNFNIELCDRHFNPIQKTETP